MRWAPRRLPVDVGDVMMNIRMDDSKNKYIGEHVSKYSQGINPYGEWGYPYKVNKNNIRPPIIDPKFYEPLSRMPVKFDSVTAGPIVKDLYGKRVEIAKVAPKTIIDKVCPDVAPRPSSTRNTEDTYREGAINLHVKQPRSSIPYHPSMPVHVHTGVPQVELDPKINIRPQMGIHFPFHVSDQSRDVNNMRTPQHVAVKPGYKAPYTFVQSVPDTVTDVNPDAPFTQTAAQSNVIAPVPTVSNLTREGPDLTPKVQTSAWYNPNYYLTDLSGYSIGDRDQICLDPKIQTAAKAPANYRMIDHSGHDVPITTKQALNTSRQTNVSSRLLQDGEIGEAHLPDSLHLGDFQGKATVPTIQEHSEFTRARQGRGNQQFHFIGGHGPHGTPAPKVERQTGIREKLNVQHAPVNKYGLEPKERLIPVGTGRFVQNTF